MKLRNLILLSFTKNNKRDQKQWVLPNGIFVKFQGLFYLFVYKKLIHDCIIFYFCVCAYCMNTIC